MKRYYNNNLNRYYIEGQTLTFKVNESTLFSGVPTEEQLLAWGFEEYIAPEPEPVDNTKYEPYTDEVVIKLKALMQEQVSEQSDEKALENIELFPTWISKLGETVEAGERLYYNDSLWKVIQSHTVQDNWRPDISTSLFTQVTIYADDGTIDNPIEYSLNMELTKDKYYIENNVVYLCIQSHPQSVWHLSDLIGTFVQIVK